MTGELQGWTSAGPIPLFDAESSATPPRERQTAVPVPYFKTSQEGCWSSSQEDFAPVRFTNPLTVSRSETLVAASPPVPFQRDLGSRPSHPLLTSLWLDPQVSHQMSPTYTQYAWSSECGRSSTASPATRFPPSPVGSLCVPPSLTEVLPATPVLPQEVTLPSPPPSPPLYTPRLERGARTSPRAPMRSILTPRDQSEEGAGGAIIVRLLAQVDAPIPPPPLPPAFLTPRPLHTTSPQDDSTPGATEVPSTSTPSGVTPGDGSEPASRTTGAGPPPVPRAQVGAGRQKGYAQLRPIDLQRRKQVLEQRSRRCVATAPATGRLPTTAPHEVPARGQGRAKAAPRRTSPLRVVPRNTPATTVRRAESACPNRPRTPSRDTVYHRTLAARGLRRL